MVLPTLRRISPLTALHERRDTLVYEAAHHEACTVRVFSELLNLRVDGFHKLKCVQG